MPKPRLPRKSRKKVERQTESGFKPSARVGAERKELSPVFPNPFFKGEGFLRAEEAYRQKQAEAKKKKGKKI